MTAIWSSRASICVVSGVIDLSSVITEGSEIESNLLRRNESIKVGLEWYKVTGTSLLVTGECVLLGLQCCGYY